MYECMNVIANDAEVIVVVAATDTAIATASASADAADVAPDVGANIAPPTDDNDDVVAVIVVRCSYFRYCRCWCGC